MASTLINACLALVFLGFFVFTLPSVEAQAEEDVEEEETSCQGAFDLYFVLDK